MNPTGPIAVILCGGAGSRLWPVSRAAHPKPFLRLAGGLSLLQEACLRACSIPGIREVVTVGGTELFFKIADEWCALPAADRVAASVLLEPVARNTGPAIAAAALDVRERFGGDTVMYVFPADHLIADLPAFAQAAQEAARLAEEGRIVAFGLKPDYAATGYGYIRHRGTDVLRFVEKPDIETAQRFVASGEFLWNAGMFCFRAATLLDEMDRCCPDILASADAAVRGARESRVGAVRRVELDAAGLSTAPELSIDYALMERTRIASVVPCELGWTDVGSWQVLAAMLPRDGKGNSSQGEVRFHDASDCYVQSGANRVVGIVGVEGLVVVDTADALLVTRKERSQDVRHLYLGLQAEDHKVHKLHQTVHRPWGTYAVLEESQHYKVKRIQVKPGASLSLQLHRHRSEHWVVVSGVAGVVKGEQSFLLRANESTTIATGEKHRLNNPGTTDLHMIEIQSGNYLGEDDIVRFNDEYGRT